MAVEQYCSDVATEILLPARELNAFGQVGRVDFDALLERVSTFARQRKISRAMVAYRLYRAGSVSHRTWADLKERFKQDWLQRREREALLKAGIEGGPSYYVVRRHRIGNALLGLVSRSLGEGLLNYTKAGRLLGVRPRNVEPLLSLEPAARGRE